MVKIMVNTVDRIIDAVAWAKVQCMLTNISEPAERKENLIELADAIQKAQVLIKDYPDVLPFEVRVTMRACEMGLEKLTQKFTTDTRGSQLVAWYKGTSCSSRASNEPRCHPGDKCDNFPDCEGCGPARQ